MGKIFIRIDDRLIHGQIITAWVNSLNITHIIAVDDELSKNDVMKQLMLMGIPKDYKARVISSIDAIKLLEKTKEETRVLLVTRYCRNLYEIPTIVSKCEYINIGNTSKQENEVFTYKGFGVGGVISLNNDDVNTLKFFINQNIKVIIQQMPNDKELLIKEILK